MVVKREQQRRFSDKVRAVFHKCCDEGELEVAEALLRQMGQIIDEPLCLPTGFDRRQPERLTAPAERLMNLLLWHTQTTSAELPVSACRPGKISQ